jgi:DNA-binding protein YbaB
MMRTFDGRSADRLATASVDGDGTLIDLRLDPELLYRATAGVLRASVLEAIRDARAAAAERTDRDPDRDRERVPA